MKYKIQFDCKQPWQTHIECFRQILIPHIWHCSVDFGVQSFSVILWQLAICNWHLLLCPVPTNLLSTFGTGSSTKSSVPRNIFIFNCTLDAKPFKIFRCACGSVMAFIKFQLKSYEDVLEISKSFFKHHTVFLLTLGVSNIHDAIGLPYNPTARLWSGGIVVIQLVLLYPFNLLWSLKTWLFGAFL